VIGLSAAEAESQLQALGLVTTTELIESSDEDRGNVVSTVPGPGTELAEGETVRLQIGAGPAGKPVTDVEGLTRADAVAALRRDGFRPQVQEEFSDDVEEGRVISQRPAAGEELPENGTVVIVVSRGSEEVRVPDLQQRSLTTATQLLEAEGLVRGGVSEQPSTDFAPGTVIRQNPGPGTRVQRGTSVSVVVAKAPDQIEVPDVIGNGSATATDKLRGIGFEVETESVADDAPAGEVIDQSPARGTLVNPGTVVRITVSDGPVEETVPELPQPSTSPAVPAPAPTP
jgi:serine/threonine-protein kinase